MPEQQPKLEFEINTPTTVHIVKMFKEGESAYGPWYGYNVKHDGVDKTMFADEQLHAEIGQQKDVVITKKQVKDDSKRGYHFQWVVNEALFDNKGNVVVPEPDVVKDPKAYESFRKDRTLKLAEAIEDVLTAITIVNETNVPVTFSSEDIRAMAISLLISFDRRTS